MTKFNYKWIDDVYLSKTSFESILWVVSCCHCSDNENNPNIQSVPLYCAMTYVKYFIMDKKLTFNLYA